MKSPLVFASQCLSDMEDRWIPYSSLWWRFWTPRIPVGERYQEGVFEGYGDLADDDSDDSDQDMGALDIRRVLAIPFMRHIYKRLPYIDVVPVTRPWEEMPPSQHRQREAFITESTLAAYDAGKPLYPRATIEQIESQLNAAGAVLARRRAPPRPRKFLPFFPKRLRLKHRIRQTLFAHCEAPQTAFLSFPAFDGITTHVSTWAPGAALAVGSYHPAESYEFDDDDGSYRGDVEEGVLYFRPGRSQVEFRTIQELTQPDPENFVNEFVPDSWMEGVGYRPIVVRRRVCDGMGYPFVGGGEEEGEQMGVERMAGRLGEDVRAVLGSGEWKGLVDAVGEEGEVLKGVDKVVFFYSNGFSGEGDYCKRAMFLFAEAVCLRNLVQNLRGGERGEAERIPIFMPAFDIRRRWNDDEKEFLCANGVHFVESNGELFLKADERAVLVSYRNWNPVKQVVADIARPAALICRSVSNDPEQDFAWKEEEVQGHTVRVPVVRSRFVDVSSIVADPDSPRVRKLVKDYDRFVLPELPGDTVEMEDLSLYVRRCLPQPRWHTHDGILHGSGALAGQVRDTQG